MMSPVDKIAELFGSAGASDYLGEPVTVAARLLQSGALASAAGAAWLTQWFPPAVTEPIRLHVPAKRYLCAVEPSYFGRLSVQGGPMTPAEAREFAADPYASDAVAVRRWDDEAKDPGIVVPGFDHYRPLLETLLSAA